MFNLKGNTAQEAYAAPRCEIDESVLTDSVLAESPEGNLEEFDYIELF